MCFGLPRVGLAPVGLAPVGLAPVGVVRAGVLRLTLAFLVVPSDLVVSFVRDAEKTHYKIGETLKVGVGLHPFDGDVGGVFQAKRQLTSDFFHRF